MSEPDTAAALVVAFGERVFGPEWKTALSRFAGVNRRTLDRLYTAHREGRDYPAARGVLASLHEALAAVERDLRPHGRQGAP